MIKVYDKVLIEKKFCEKYNVKENQIFMVKSILQDYIGRNHARIADLNNKFITWIEIEKLILI